MNVVLSNVTLEMSDSSRMPDESASVAPLRKDAEDYRTAAKTKATAEWQNELWMRWPREDCWPAKMDVYEAAAYLRVSPDTIRRAVTVARDGKARLAHQRLGALYRIRKIDLDDYGMVPGRGCRA
jgi:excisionase family DNA binding protein